MTRLHQKLSLLCLCAMAAIMTSCVPGPKYVRPSASAPAPAAYKENAPPGWKQAEPSDAVLRGDWWKIYNDAELNQLEAELNTNNQNLVQSFQNYMAARASVREARASYFPIISTAPSISRSGVGGSSTERTANSSSLSSFELPISASWEPDLFGKIRNTVREYSNAAQVSAATLQNERLSEQASLAQYVFELRGEDALQQIYDETVKSYKSTLSLTQTLFETGIDSQQDVAQAETNLRTTEATASSIGISRAQYEHAIALLVGQNASTFSLPTKPLEATPPQIPIGVPSQLLERRPDIAAAERTVAEANALIGVGKSAYYPTIALSASFGTQTSEITKLLSWPARFWSLGSSLSETLIDFGARRAAVQQYEAQYNADVAAYRQAVLNAFKEVEDDLVATRILVDQEEKQRRAVGASQKYLDIALTRYQTGVDTYLNVLTAQNSLLNNRQTELSILTSRMTYSVQLIAALGGGWDTSQVPSEKEVAQKQ